MLEVEAKFRLPDPAAIERRLLALGARLIADHVEADHYLNAPDRDFARTDEALRLRRIGPDNFLTYKGPRRDSTSKTRQELELPCPPGDDSAKDFLELFGLLGYRPTAVVQKQRKIYEWNRDRFRVHACLDAVEKVGSFVELEIVADEADYALAHETLFQIAAELDLGATETRSYLEQLLGRAVTPGGDSTK